MGYLFNNVTARYKIKKTGGGDGKTKIVLFEYFIAFISILQCMVNWLKLFLTFIGLVSGFLELTFL